MPSSGRSPQVARWVDWGVGATSSSSPSAALCRPSIALPPRAATTAAALERDPSDICGWATPPGRGGGGGGSGVTGSSSPVTPSGDDAPTPTRREGSPIDGRPQGTRAPPAGSPPTSMASSDWPQRPEAVDPPIISGGTARAVGGGGGGGWGASSPPFREALPAWEAGPSRPAAGRSSPVSRQCAHCGTTKTSQWRTGGRIAGSGGSGRGGDGGAPAALPYTLCNACGIKHRRRGQSAAAAVAAGKEAGALSAAAGRSRGGGDGDDGGGSDGNYRWQPAAVAVNGSAAGSPWGVYGPSGPPPTAAPLSSSPPAASHPPPFGLATELFGMYEGGGRRRGVAKRAYVRRRRAEAGLSTPPRGGGALASLPARAAAVAAVATAATATAAAAGGAPSAADGGGRSSGGLPPLPPPTAAAATATAAVAGSGRAVGGGTAGASWRVAPLRHLGRGGEGGYGGPVPVAARQPLLPSFAAVLSASGLR